jgi:hypothetical protein
MSWLQMICSEVVLRRLDLKRSLLARRKAGFNLYPKHATSLYYAASFGIEHAVKALLEQGAEVNATGGRVGATAFHAAALRGHVKVMDILFQAGADPNQVDFINKTPLNTAAEVNHVEVIKYLLDHGADPEIKDDQQKTPYDWAYMLGHEEAQKLLEPVTRGKDPDPTNFQLTKAAINFLAHSGALKDNTTGLMTGISIHQNKKGRLLLLRNKDGDYVESVSFTPEDGHAAAPQGAVGHRVKGPGT